MSELEAQPPLEKLSTRLEDITVGIKGLLLVLVLLFSILNFITGFAIERFREVFADTLPGKPLPSLSLFVFSTAGFLRALTLAFPLVAIANMFLLRRSRTWMIATAIILFLIGLQIVVTWISFYLPTVTLDPGPWQDAGAK